MTLEGLNQLSEELARTALHVLCGSDQWSERMARARPFRDLEAVHRAADRIWNELSPEDWKEAFSHHPRIGDMRTAAARTEQSGALSATAECLRELAEMNADYERRFGHVFLICATGRSAPEMLEALRARISNSPDRELSIAAAEQAKITRIRLTKLLKENP